MKLNKNRHLTNKRKQITFLGLSLPLLPLDPNRVYNVNLVFLINHNHRYFLDPPGITLEAHRLRSFCCTCEISGERKLVQSLESQRILFMAGGTDMGRPSYVPNMLAAQTGEMEHPETIINLKTIPG